MNFEEKRNRLVQKLIDRKVLSSIRVINADEKVERHQFVPDGALSSAYIDSPLSIGLNQTIGAPHMNAMMCEYLELKEGDKVLEIGTGSGYHAALCAELIAPLDSKNPGHVFSIERHIDLVKTARNSLKITGYNDRVTVIHGDGTLGHLAEAPYDKILVTASSPKKIPPPFKEQLRNGGILCIPAGVKDWAQDLYIIQKKGNEFKVEKKAGVRFVPLIGKYGFD